ncbi:5-formyltetrahydrofolate cyclo-ligase [Salipaludibacillus agaradhaerens]|uniref:5-formyltetrahydrofolate cyclo-ligase n=1 Tax=Salipaludibacillus agaradhaerens TaxID=76935 RepID=UPI000995F5E7|nr:5-formyltetrahydrofolate cyclo-ligase [Salipaludibacillus agaradhaerens]
MTKSEWRQWIKEKLYKYPETIQVKETQLIHEKLFSHSVWKQASTIGVTVSIKNEINTLPIIEQAWQEGKQIVVPRCRRSDNSLLFYHLTCWEELQESFYGLQEPDVNKCSLRKRCDIDLVIVPGLVFDEKGYRIGYGGGYYDRFLTGECPFSTISLCYEFQVTKTLPIDTYDRPVNWLVTPERVIKTNSEKQ